MNDRQTRELDPLPGHILLSLARNESASREWRKAAVELMLDKGYKEANHPDLNMILLEIQGERRARQEVEAVVESAAESELPDQDDSPSGGALQASFTTSTMQQDTTIPPQGE